MQDSVSEFRNVMRAAGIEPPAEITAEDINILTREVVCAIAEAGLTQAEEERLLKRIK